MEYWPLGSSGLVVSKLCLGCLTFGREANEDTAQQMIRRFLDWGGNFFDTADEYGGFHSEEILGRALRSLRDAVIIATKVRFATGPGKNDVGLSRKHIIHACEASLRRLGTDYIDLYQLHSWDHITPLEETLSTLTDLVHAGKVRYIGVSNFAGWQIEKALRLSEVRGHERIISAQQQYSLVERSIEYEVLPACRAEGLALLAWGPVGAGFLTGKFKRDQGPVEGSRISKALPTHVDYWERRATDRNWAIVAVLEQVSRAVGKTPAQVAINWILQQPGVGAPILGARNLEQLQDNLGAIGWSLDAEHLALLSAASVPEDLYPYRFQRELARTF